MCHEESLKQVIKRTFQPPSVCGNVWRWIPKGSPEMANHEFSLNSIDFPYVTLLIQYCSVGPSITKYLRFRPEIPDEISELRCQGGNVSRRISQTSPKTHVSTPKCLRERLAADS